MDTGSLDDERLTIDLSDPAASLSRVAGAKAANLALAADAGLPIVTGIVITTAAVARGVRDPPVASQLRTAWEGLGGLSGRPLVVRSSSTVEDAGTSSMAGRFTSVLDVTSWEGFEDAVDRVVASADSVRDAEGLAQPLAVLVQQQVDTHLGGVLFGLDPVSGRRDRIVVEMVGSGPDALVSGRVSADHYVLSRRGRIVERSCSGAAPSLSRRLARKLAALAHDTADVFACPQDVEWAVDANGRLLLLQSRPVTAVADSEAGSIVFGPGPVAETFPAPLSPLESDLWISPLRDGICRALRATRAVSSDALARSPVVTTVGGWAAVDLELLGLTARNPSLRHRMRPTAILRRLAAAWSVGRLRVAMPQLCGSVVATVDRDLATVPALVTLREPDLVELVRRTKHELATVHSYEVLAGMLLPADPGAPASLVALSVVAAGRANLMSADDMVENDPIVLALVAPALFAPIVLPAAADLTPHRPVQVASLGPREALRLRARWLQELHCRAIETLAERLVDVGRLAGSEDITALSVDEIDAVVCGRSVLRATNAQGAAVGPPLPSAFRLTPSGAIRETGHGRRGDATGLPAASGRAVGEARHRVAPGSSKNGTILITRHLEPHLASLLPSLDGLVSETGSALSHLAILARETGVPTVVGVPGALQRYPPGTRLVVDGSTGSIEVLDHPAQAPGAESLAGAP